jgi:hypothetical protein
MSNIVVRHLGTPCGEIDLDNAERYQLISPFDPRPEIVQAEHRVGLQALYRILPTDRVPEGGFLIVQYVPNHQSQLVPTDADAVDADTASNWLVEHGVELTPAFREELQMDRRSDPVEPPPASDLYDGSFEGRSPQNIAVYEGEKHVGYFDRNKCECLGENGTTPAEAAEFGEGMWQELIRLPAGEFALLERTFDEFQGTVYGNAQFIDREAALRFLAENNIRPPADLFKKLGLIDYTAGATPSPLLHQIEPRPEFREALNPTPGADSTSPLSTALSPTSPSSPTAFFNARTMSQRGSMDSFDDSLARLAAIEARDRQATVIADEKIRIWQSLLVEPVMGIIPRWIETLKKFADGLRGEDFVAAASAFVQLGGILAELDRVHETWYAETERWFEQQAEPWHKEYPEGGRFTKLGYESNQPLWLAKWCALCCGGGASQLPKAFHEQMDRHLPARWVEDLEVRRAPVLTVQLFANLSCENVSEPAALKWLARLPDPSRTADAALIWGALILPSSAVLETFFHELPSDAAVRSARWLINASNDAVRPLLLDDFESLCAVRQTHLSLNAPATEKSPSQGPCLLPAGTPEAHLADSATSSCPMRISPDGGALEVMTATGWLATAFTGNPRKMLQLFIDKWDSFPNGMTVEEMQASKAVDYQDIPKALRDIRDTDANVAEVMLFPKKASRGTAGTKNLGRYGLRSLSPAPRE